MVLPLITTCPYLLVILFVNLTIEQWSALIGILVTVGGILLAAIRWWRNRPEPELKRIYVGAANHTLAGKREIKQVVTAIIRDRQFWHAVRSPSVVETAEREQMGKQLQQRRPDLDSATIDRIVCPLYEAIYAGLQQAHNECWKERYQEWREERRTLSSLPEVPRVPPREDAPKNAEVVEEAAMRSVGPSFDDVGKVFKDRCEHIEQLDHLLKNPKAKLICIIGRSGIGKTALLSHMYTGLVEGRVPWPGDREIQAGGIVSFICKGAERPTLERLFHAFGEVLGSKYSEKLAECLEEGSLTLEGRVRFLLSLLQKETYYLVFDNLEELLAPDNTIADPELRTFLHLCLTTTHRLKIVATSREPITVGEQGAWAVFTIRLDDGLPEQDAAALLRDLDPDGERGLRDERDEMLREIARRYSGIPRALEVIAGILSSDPTATLTTLLKTPAVSDEQVMNTLIVQRYQHVTDEQRRVLEALAVFEHPVPADAVSFLLQPFFPSIAVSRCLRDLVRDYLVTASRSDGTYGLHSLDQKYIYATIPDAGDHYTKKHLHRQQVHYYVTQSAFLLSDQYRDAPRAHTRSRSFEFAQRAMHAAEALEDDLARGWAYQQAGNVFQESKRFADALALVKKASDYAEKAGDTLTLAQALGRRYGVEAKENTEFGQVVLIERAILLAEAAGDAQVQASLWQTHATVCLRLEQWSAADEALQRMEQLARELADQDLLANNVQIRGELYAHSAQWEKAAEQLTKAWKNAEQLGNKAKACAAMGWLGVVKGHLGEIAEGMELVCRALQTERDVLDSREGTAKWLHALGGLLWERGETERALASLTLSRDLRDELGHWELPKTESKLQEARERLGDDGYRRWQEAFDPRQSEFGEYAFLWGFTHFRKYSDNPILAPQGSGWESRSVYNPTAWTDETKVYLLYRAEGPCDFPGREVTSRIGLAVSTDGFTFKREARPVLEPGEPYDVPGGCEDPRLVRIGDMYYLTYTAFDGKVARLAMAVSSDLRTWEKWGPLFTDEQWDQFFRREAFPKAPRGWSKSGALLPQTIKGEYWMYFGDTDIWAAHSADLRHWEVDPHPVLSPRAGCFDAQLVEPGPAPLLLPEGIWLGYNAADGSLRYSFGQALFAADDPTNLLRRSPRPLLEPTTAEEIEGQVNQVVFGEGLVLFKGQWFLYYGMADSRIGVAMADAP